MNEQAKKPQDNSPYSTLETGTSYVNVVDKYGVMVASCPEKEMAEQIADLLNKESPMWGL